MVATEIATLDLIKEVIRLAMSLPLRDKIFSALNLLAMVAYMLVKINVVPEPISGQLMVRERSHTLPMALEEMDI